MKKTRATKTRKRTSDDMRPEYRFDYREAHPNRFTNRPKERVLVVMIDPEVAQVFTTPESVNGVLRAVVDAMPRATKSKITTRRKSQ
jgi:hypothetical protein